MSVADIKEELHKAIDGIDNKELLQAMLVLLSRGKRSYQLTDEQLQVVKEREEQYLSGDNKTQTLEEFREKMNKKNGL